MGLAGAVERLRIARYQTRLRASGIRALGGLSAAGVLGAIMGLALGGLSLALDAWALPAIGLGTKSPPEVVPLLTAIAGFTGLLTVSVSAAAGPVQAAAGRLPIEVTAELIDDPSRDALLRLIVVTFVAAGTLLFAEIVLGLTVRIGALFMIVVAATTLTAVVGYIGTRLQLYRPASLAQRWATDMVRWNRGIALGPETKAGRSVTAHVRKRYEARLRQFETLTVALVPDQEREALAVFNLLGQVLWAEIILRHRIPGSAEWSPMREEFVSGYDMTVTPVFRTLALGRPRLRVRDQRWVERRFAAITTAALQKANTSPSSEFVSGVVSTVDKLIAFAFDRQEFSTVDALLDVIESTVATEELRRQASNSLPGVPLRLAELADAGLNLERLEEFLKGRSEYPSLKRIIAADLPTEIGGVLVDVGHRLEVGDQISTDYSVSFGEALSEVRSRLISVESEVRQRYRDRAAALFAAMLSSGDDRMVVAATGSALLAAHRRIVNGDWTTASVLLQPTVGSLATVLAADHGEDGEAVLDQAFLLAQLSVVHAQVKVAELLVRPVSSALMARAMKDPTNRRLHELLALGGLALVESELDQQPSYVAMVFTGIGDAHIDPVVLGARVAALATNGRLPFPIPWHMPFYDILRRLDERLEALPRRPGRELEGFARDDEPDHPSKFIRDLGEWSTMGIDLDDIQLAFARHISGQPVTDDGENDPDEEDADV
jgi:hypothetical protein